MKTKLLVTTFLLSTIFALAQAVQWSFNSAGTQFYQSHVLANDALGNVYSVGNYSGATDFDPGSGVYNLSSTNGNMFILKLDTNGNFVWAKQIGGGAGSYVTNTANAITIDTSGNIYVAGTTKSYFSPSVDFDPGVGVFNVALTTNKNVDYILKLDASGNFVWAKTITNSTGNNFQSWDVIKCLKVDASGNVYATGSFTGMPDFDPNVGVFNITVAESVDIFMLKLDSTGSLVWAKALPYDTTTPYTVSSVFNCGHGIDVDASGNVYTIGYFSGGLDANPGAGVSLLTASYVQLTPQTGTANIFISKLDAQGNFVWANKIVGDRDVSHVPSIAVDGSGNLIIAGYTKGITSNEGAFADYNFGSGTYNLPDTGGPFVLKVDANGTFIWAKNTVQNTMSANTMSFANGLTLDSLNNIYTIGSFQGVCDFNPSATSNVLTATATDAYVSKIDTNGDYVFSNKIGGSGDDEVFSVAVASSGSINLWGRTSSGFTRSVASVLTGGFLQSITQPALSATQIEWDNYIMIYPNPTNNAINLNLKSVLEKATLKIISITGQTVFEKQNLSGTDFNVDVSNLTQGIYIVQLTSGNEFYTSKFIKQ